MARIYDIDCSGRPLINAPKWVVNAGYEHSFDLGGSGRIIAGIDTRIESSRYLSLDYLALGQQDSYMMSNARLNYETASGKLAVTAFVNNIENELVFANSVQSPAKPGVIYNQIASPGCSRRNRGNPTRPARAGAERHHHQFPHAGRISGRSQILAIVRSGGRNRHARLYPPARAQSDDGAPVSRL